MNTEAVRIPQVRVLNPNSSQSVTDSVARAMRATVDEALCRFDCHTATDGPPGIVTQDDYELGAQLVVADFARHAAQADAFVVACFSDPGAAQARRASAQPVIGLGEAGLRDAIAQGDRVGVIAIANAAIPRHLRHWDALGLRASVVNERPLDLPVHLSGVAEHAFARMVSVARQLIDEDGANALLMGCAGMADLRAQLEAEVGVPVVDPCQAAARAALRLTQRAP